MTGRSSHGRSKDNRSLKGTGSTNKKKRNMEKKMYETPEMEEIKLKMENNLMEVTTSVGEGTCDEGDTADL